MYVYKQRDIVHITHGIKVVDHHVLWAIIYAVGIIPA